MSPKTTCLLLCVLLSTTLGHEWFAKHQSLQENRHARSLSRHQHHQLEARAASPEVCEWVCDGEGTTVTVPGLSILVNETTNLFAVVNITANVALIVDINANIVGIFNGNTGDVVVIDLKTEVGVYLTAKQTSLVWVSSKQSFELFFNALVSLKVFLNIQGGQKFNLSAVGDAIIKVVGQILVHLIKDIEITKDVLKVLVVQIKLLVTVLVGSLSGILAVIGKGLIKIQGDILWLVSVLQGIGEVIAGIEGGLALLIKKGVVFNFEVLLKARDGVNLLVNLLLQIGAKVNLVVLKSILGDLEKLFSIIVKLGGSVSTGVTGVFKVALNIILLIKNKIKLEVLLQVLLEFSASGATDIDVFADFEGLLEVVKQQKVIFNNEIDLKFLVEIISNKNNWVVGGINIYEIIQVVAKGVVKGGLELIISVLVALKSVLKLAVSIPTLLLHLITSLNSKIGLGLVLRIIKGLEVNVSGSENILKQILKDVNILQLFAGGLSISSIISRLPIIGNIYKAISVALSAQASVSIDVVFSSSESVSILAQIKEYIFVSLGISGGGSATATESSGSFFTWSWQIGG